MAIFTPGLKVVEKTIVVKDRRLPLHGSVQVKVGQKISATDVVARTELPGKIYPVNVANQLGVPASRLKSCMKKSAGDSVKEGEVIAESPGILGLFKSQAQAIVSGTIESISPISGEVIFQAEPVPVEIDAYIDGQVVEVIEKEGCVIQAQATLVQGIFGLGGEEKGELILAVKSPKDVLTPEMITDQMKNKIIIGGCYTTIASLKKAISIGAKGIITGGFDYDDIKEILGKEVGVAITGGEELGLTIVVTEGFGKIDMAPATFALLSKYNRRQASINGATQIRAGVIRPEVVVTHQSDNIPSTKWKAPEPEGIKIGDTVRGIRTPYFGKIGKVSGLPVSLKTMESETKVRVLEVRFEDGERAVLPRANVESIQQ